MKYLHCIMCTIRKIENMKLRHQNTLCLYYLYGRNIVC